MEVFEDEVIPFESINVDTTQRVIYSTRSISFEWIEYRLDPGDDDKYYQIIHKGYKGYKCYLGDVNDVYNYNGSAIKILLTLILDIT